MPIPIAIAAAAAVATVGGAAAAVYKSYKNKKSQKEDAARSAAAKHELGSFVVWGRPGSGKTTFITRLRNEPPRHQKQPTTKIEKHPDVRLSFLEMGDYVVKFIDDIPGTVDRLSFWHERVKECDHVFYIVDLHRLTTDASYKVHVGNDIKGAVKCLQEVVGKDKRINIIATHVDRSKWKDAPAAEVNNKLSEDDLFREIYELAGDVKGYVYVANLLDDKSAKELLKSVVGDIVSRRG